MIEILAIAILATSMIFYVWRIALLRSSQSIVAIEIGIDGKCAFQTRNGRWHTGKLRGTSFVSPSLTILNLQPHDGRYTRNVVIVPDNAESEDFRQLRIWLRWKR